MQYYKRLITKTELNELVFTLDDFQGVGYLRVLNEFVPDLEGLADEHGLSGISVHNVHTSEVQTFREVPDEIVIEEFGVKFRVHLKEKDINFSPSEYELRKVISEYSNGKIILDLFTNEGDMTLTALKSGARKVITIENRAVREKFLKNCEFNGLKNEPSLEIWNEDINTSLELFRETEQKFDLIICRLKGEYAKKDGVKWDMGDEHKELLRTLQNEILKDRGVLIFVSYEENFVLDNYIRPGADKLTKKLVSMDYQLEKPFQVFAFYN